jgi:hypothetical protein
MKMLIYPFSYSLNIIYYVLYALIWKNIFKRIIRIFTNKHEIQRIIEYKSHTKLSKIILNHLASCILNSNELQNIHILLNKNSIISNENIEKILNTIREVKKIDDKNFYKKTKEILECKNRLIMHKEKLKEYYTEKFDSQNKEHTYLLFRIWEVIKGNKDINLIDKKWCKIIFITFSGVRIPRTRSYYRFKRIWFIRT